MIKKVTLTQEKSQIHIKAYCEHDVEVGSGMHRRSDKIYAFNIFRDLGEACFVFCDECAKLENVAA